MNPPVHFLRWLPLAAVLAAPLAARLAAQVGLGHEVGWLPEPAGTLVAAKFADMNGDGFDDLVRLRPQAIELLLQDAATGRFGRAWSLVINVTTALELRDLAIGRLDASGDTLPDVAVVWSNGDVDVLANVGGTALQRVLPRPVPALPLAAGISIDAVELDGDGIDDLLVLLESTPPQYLRGSAGGTFTNVSATNVPAAAAYPRPRIAIADTDGDGDLDIVIASVNPLPPTLLRNQGGSFAVQVGAFGSSGISTGSILAVQLVGSALPELVFGAAGNALASPTVLGNVAGSFNSPSVAQNLRLRGALAMAAVDVDRDGFDDVVFLEATGRVGFALRGAGGQLLGQPTSTANVTETVPLLTAYPGRSWLVAADHDGDGDVDLATGGDGPDSLLIHGPGAEFHDSERLAFPPSRRGADYAGALVDRDHDGNLDFVGLYPSGAWQALDNDGSGYFAELGSAAGVPLPLLAQTTIWHELAPLALTASGRFDLLAFGDGSGVSDQIAVLRNTGAAWIDATAVVFAGPATGVIAAVAPLPDASGRDHLVLGTFAGELEFHENIGGAFVRDPSRFPTGLGLFNLSQLLVADFTGDSPPDVLALQSANAPPRLFAATATGYVAVPFAVPLSAVGDRGTVGDLDDDGDLDVVLRTVGQVGVSVLRWNQQASAFGFAALGQLANVGFEAVDVAVVRVGNVPHVVLARADGPDVALAWNSVGYGTPSLLSYRGTPITRGLLTADVERDRDVDLLVLRAGLDPAVLVNETVDLQPLGPLQSGRSGQVLLRAPAVGSLSFLSFGLPLDTLTPWGLLRLDPATMGTFFLGAPPGREVTWTLSLPPGLSWFRFPIQAAWITPANQVVLSGLEFLTILPR
ncbi:MAG: VCBS repeat-containing protein [Planctomycetes bacterium]|nr:VCBS repeat-containing protein [Planctomycetota bacterium]